MGVLGKFFVYLLKIPVGIFKEMFIEVFGVDFEQNIHPFLLRSEFQGEVELCPPPCRDCSFFPPR